MPVAIIPRKFLSIFLTISSIIYLQATTINDCIHCNDINLQKLYSRLLEMDIDQKQDIIELSNLQLFKPKPIGGCTGGIYCDSNQIYYVKQSNPFTELIGSKIMNLIMGTHCTPVVKLIIDQINCVASLELPNFQTQKYYNENFITPYNNAIGKVDLIVAMDFLGLVDRHSRNLGYILSPNFCPIAARIDFDACFSFDKVKPSLNTQYDPNSNHLCLSLLYYTIKKYPKPQIISSIKKIISIPDEQIMMAVLQAYVALSQKDPIDLDPFLVIANKLIERKNLFRETIECRDSPIYKAMQRQYLKSKYKAFNQFFLDIFPIHYLTVSKKVKTFIRNFICPSSPNLVPMANININEIVSQ